MTVILLCSTPGCGRQSTARGMCKKCYARWKYHLPGHRVGEPQQLDPSDKITYLSSLSRPELAAYCTGVASRASVTPGDPDEVAGWMELVRVLNAGRDE